MIFGDFHTHTRYSDGKGKIIDNVQAAVDIGLKQIGISDHGLYHVAFGLRQPDLSKMRNEIDKLKEKFDIEILLGVEANIYNSSGAVDLKGVNRNYFDYVIAGYHQAVLNPNMIDYFKYNIFGMGKKHFSKTQINRFTNAFVNAIKTQRINMISHLFYGLPVDTLTVAKAAGDYGVLIELNGKKVSIPDDDINILVDNKNVQFIVNSDAHRPSRIGDVEVPMAVVNRLNIDKNRIVNWEKIVKMEKR